jgi:hypothetical protein
MLGHNKYARMKLCENISESACVALCSGAEREMYADVALLMNTQRLKNAVFLDVAPCGLVRTDVLEEHVASVFNAVV